MNRPITKKDFTEEVVNNSNLTLVQFLTEWNGACQIMAPIYNELSVSYENQVKFFTVDVDRDSGLNIEYGVMELPTILFFRSGVVIDHIRGLAPRQVMIMKIENALVNEFN